jgi:hypothetical protein
MIIHNFEEIENMLLGQMERNPNFANRVWADDYVKVWLSGEIALAELTGIVPDFCNKFNGDGGVDSHFILNINENKKRMTINIKTSKKPYNLLAEDKRNKADIYILAHYFPETKRSNLLGWEFGSVLYKAPFIDIPVKDGVKQFHAIPLHKLRDIQILKDRMVKDG